MNEDQLNFATVAGVFADGLTLIFDGEEEASEKRYKCNTSILFSIGDRVRIVKDSGTYVVEYIVGNPTADYPIPTGGTSGQVLSKSSAYDYSMSWANQESELPSGGTTGQFLRKNGSATEWATVHEVPTTGTNGYFLKKTASGSEWADVGGIPSGGTEGQFLQKTRTGTAWAAVPAYSGPTINGSSTTTLGFFGKTATTRKTVNKISTYGTADATTNRTKINEIITALIDYGLFNGY